ncbi:lithostathine-like [Notolabrus celidotus]|uniref:lithostathine-like n=1 Tax=Notolabrus celidotus TaxID=1203425 RepID=UPI0014905F8D|nr:lithostathine-like [Notolabrus celidotus]
MAHFIHLSLLMGLHFFSLNYFSCGTSDLTFYEEPKSWIDALQHCRNNRSSLVEIRNEASQKDVEELLQNKTQVMNGNEVWIGLERSIFGCGVAWKWISGSEFKNSSLWNNGLAVDPFNHHCGKIIWSENQSKLQDANCQYPLPFICQDPI